MFAGLSISLPALGALLAGSAEPGAGVDNLLINATDVLLIGADSVLLI